MFSPPRQNEKELENPDKPTLEVISDLLDSSKRENALAVLRRKKDTDLAVSLWYTSGAMTVLLLEILAIYKNLNPPSLDTNDSNRVCNALALIQVVASHKDTRMLLLQSNVPLFIYPFLNTKKKTKEFEFLRLTCLGVIGSLVKCEDPEVIRFLLSTEIIPLCLQIMKEGSELSKTVATFVVQKILFFDIGLGYVCATPDRFYAVSHALGKMVSNITTQRLLKSIIRCYLRLSDHPRAREALRQCVPPQIMNNALDSIMDLTMSRQRELLLMNLGKFNEYNPTNEKNQ